MSYPGYSGSDDYRGYKKLDADGSKAEFDVEEEEGDVEESRSLLPRPAFNGGSDVRKLKNSERKVKWNDGNGDKLFEVHEFEPSDLSGSDEDEEGEACYCPAIFLLRLLLSGSGRRRTHLRN